ncbi:hypothetical protein B0T16DRAFT_409170 [Cercophora newfieldiana]|uniref:Uncharacterized protein n=1 Tax=Cercophora newfieldiana TaxID=92897 RepID=A0AA39YBP0_9PEZI|nr:hypothetical protein B0T16DRAFT_409170 [Cercophora newfieldiana]
MDAAFAAIGEMEEARTDLLFVPTMEAHFDLNRFMAKYFLDRVFGQPVRERTPNAVALRSWVGGIPYRQGLLRVVRAIEGLSVCYFTDENGDDLVLLGWYHTALKEQKRLENALEQKRLENALKQRLAERERAKEDAESRPWVEALRPHYAYCETRTFNPKHAHQYMMAELVGSWMVKCPVIEQTFGIRPGSMTLDIWINTPRQKFGLVAALDIGIARGTALIAQTEEMLRELEDYMEGYTSDKEKRAEKGADFRKKYRNVARDESNPYKSLDWLSTPVRGSGRVYLHWMGRQIGEESVEIDPDNKNTGYINFDMQSRVVRKGSLRYVSFFP